MSLSDNYSPDISAGNGATKVFTGNWSPLSEDYMRVALQTIATGVIGSPLVEDTDYALDFTDAGYSIDFTIGVTPSSLYNVIRYREVALDQTNPYTTAKGFQGAVLENSLNKLTAICQDLRDDLDRAIVVPIGSTAPDISTFMTTLLDDISAAAARTTLGLVIGANVQAWDADLDTLAAKNMTGIGNIVLSASPTLTGTTTIATASVSTLNAGAINGPIGFTTPTTGRFTDLTTTGNISIAGTNKSLTGIWSNGVSPVTVAIQDSLFDVECDTAAITMTPNVVAITGLRFGALSAHADAAVNGYVAHTLANGSTVKLATIA